MAINTMSPNYCRSKGEQIALNVDGTSFDETNTYSAYVRFARPESEQARQRRIQSYEFLQKKQAEEPWIHLQFHGAKMWRFTQERSVMRKEIASIIKLPPEDVKEFLEHVATPRVNRGWEFLLPTDVDFIKKHPDVAHRQNMLWLGIQSK
ncbi:hypothetical protein GOODEAATRI_008159 [Goodea atripinnis]|uniref:Uncharacterized protein n=1 Tax=Goodea atripinnis TaxID=208336 RepID=A0ABV0NJY3_9TELE